MHSSLIALGLPFFLAAGQQAFAAITVQNQIMTYYYDMTAPFGDGGLCTRAGREQANWNDITYKAIEGKPALAACSKTAGEHYVAMNTNRIIAIPANMLPPSDHSLCGKEVKVYSPEGKQLILDERPFFVYDPRPGCIGSNKVDFSVKAYAQMCGGQCGVGTNGVLNNPTGWKVEITDNTVWPAA